MLDEYGWADAEIQLGDVTANVRTSFLSDPISQLAKELVCLLDDPFGDRLYDCSGRVIFGGELDGLRLVFREIDDAQVYRGPHWREVETNSFTYKPPALHLRRVWMHLESAECWMGEDAEWIALTKAIVPLDALGNEVDRVLSKLYEEHGLAGYVERWLDGDFPLAPWGHIRRLLGMPPKTIQLT